MADDDTPRTKLPNTGSEDIPPGATRKAFDREQPPVDGSAPEPRTTLPGGTQPAEEWGQRQDTGKQIARGGKTSGNPPGTNPQG